MGNSARKQLGRRVSIQELSLEGGKGSYLSALHDAALTISPANRQQASMAARLTVTIFAMLFDDG